MIISFKLIPLTKNESSIDIVTIFTLEVNEIEIREARVSKLEGTFKLDTLTGNDSEILRMHRRSG